MDASLWISSGSLAVSLLALWRSGRNRVSDLRTSLLKEVADLRHSLKTLETNIPVGVGSRIRVGAAMGTTGAHLAFKATGDADLATVKKLWAEIATAEELPFWASYSTVEAKALVAQGIRARVTQLSDKYKAAWAEDEKAREYLRNAAIARPRQ